MNSTLLFTLWILAFSFPMYQLLKKDQALYSQGTKLAKLVLASDSETLQSGSLKWLKVHKGFWLGPGDYLKTGTRGKAQIRFKDGKMLKMGANSFVKFNTQQSSERDIKLKLIEGDINLKRSYPKNRRYPKRNIRIQTGGKSLIIDQKVQRLNISRDNKTLKVKGVVTILSGTVEQVINTRKSKIALNLKPTSNFNNNVLLQQVEFKVPKFEPQKEIVKIPEPPMPDPVLIPVTLPPPPPPPLPLPKEKPPAPIVAMMQKKKTPPKPKLSPPFDLAQVTGMRGISFDNIKMKRSKRILPYPKKNQYRYIVFLGDKKSFIRMKPILAANRSFSLQSYQRPNNNGTFIVRGGKLIGHVVGPKLKRSQARILLTALRAESIYFGPRSAVTFNPLADIKNRKQALYISKNGRSIRVNEKILRDPAATKEFLRDIRSTVFKQQVEILASK